MPSALVGVMSMTELKKLGVIGGVGPLATARLFRRVVELTDAHCDQEHLDVTVLNRPQIPDRSAYLLGQPGARSFVEPMQQAARELEAAGCEVVATPCNTAHAREAAIASALTRARFVSMVGEVVRLLAYVSARRVGVLATDGTVHAGVYGYALASCGIEVAYPDAKGQREVVRVIYEEAKARSSVQAGCLDELFRAFAQAGCDAVVLGCTELSLVDAPLSYRGMVTVDALDVLAAACVRASGAQVRKGEVERSFDGRLAQALLQLQDEGGE
ncbi:MAG: amino acid racemase [Eggerthellaceae bacterium]|nr:amino acid racemase [Eggerthellaceae bacterium]